MTDLNTIKDFTAALRATETGTKAYDTAAEVIRVDGSTAWVHIPGGVDETPAQLTIDAKPGDTVNVRVSGGRAWITGNGSRPPTDDTAANWADKKAAVAQDTADYAQETAIAAAKQAAATRNYFWHDEDGAHVATVEGDATTGKNVLIDSDGMSIRNGTTELASFESDLISLGKASDSAQISMINDTGLIRKVADTNALYIEGLSSEETFWAGHIGLFAQAAPIEGYNDAYIRIIGQNQDPGPYGSGFGSIIHLVADDISIGSDSGVEINGYRAINASGQALKAISDSNGNNIIETYLPITHGVITDLDEALENGFYRYGNTAENRPNAAGGSLMVLHWSDAYTYQIACPNNAAGNAVLYTRIKTSTGWGDWTRNIGQQDITHYVHEQAVSSDTWTIDHNLGYFPSVTVVDSAGNVVKGETEYTSANQVILSFAGSFAGKAYLN